MRKEHRPGDNTQEAIRGVLIELLEDCINRGLINSLKSQMKSKLFIYFVCLIFAPLSTITSQLTESSGQSHVCVVPQGRRLFLSLAPSFTHTQQVDGAHGSHLYKPWLRSSLEPQRGTSFFWIITESPRMGLFVIPASATRWQNPNPKPLLGWSCRFHKDPQEKDSSCVLAFAVFNNNNVSRTKMRNGKIKKRQTDLTKKPYMNAAQRIVYLTFSISQSTFTVEEKASSRYC